MSSPWLDASGQALLGTNLWCMHADLLQCWCGTACVPDYDTATAGQLAFLESAFHPSGSSLPVLGMWNKTCVQLEIRHILQHICVSVVSLW
jgi:hypothetical protein